MVKPRKIMIVDDHPMVRALLASLLHHDQFDIAGETGSVHEALSISKNTSPDMAVIDIALDDGNGIELIKRLLREQPKLAILVCSSFEEEVYGPRVADLGARGYVNKKESPDAILAAVTRIAEGKTSFSEAIESRRSQSNINKESGSALAGLSNRELEVFSLIGKGISVSKIAEQLHLSVKTVEAHRENIKHKLNLGSAGELIHYAVQWTLENA